MLTTVVHDCSQVQRRQRARYLPFILAVSILITAGRGTSSPVATVSVSLTPSKVSLPTAQTQQFTAAVKKTTNTAVTWSVSPAVGTISSGGLYSAPATLTSPQTVTVTATSVADTSKNATASVTVVPAVQVTVSPSTASLAPSGTQQFAAAVTGTTNTAVTWSVSPAVGTISSSGLYSAPATLGSPQTVTVTATRLADTSKKATASVTVVPPVQVTVSPSTASLAPSGTRQFTVAVTGTTNTAVTWSVSPAVGTISGGGLYSAPAALGSPQTVTVTATSAADTSKTATASMTIVPSVQVTVSPSAASLAPSGTQKLTAEVTGTTNTAVTWSVSPAVGTISSGGLYSAPATLTSPQTVTVTATSVADTSKKTTASVTVVPAVQVTVSPSTANLAASQTRQFTVTVTGTTNTAVTWSISPAVGIISSGGLYSAPATVSSATSVTVTAVSVADSTKSAAAVISLAPPSLTITTSSLPGGTAGAPYSASLAVTGGTGPYTWSVQSGQLAPGLSLSASGIISGTPSTEGVYTVTMQVLDITGQKLLKSFNLAIAAALVITSVTLPNGTAETAYSATLSATGGGAPYSWSVVSGDLPPAVTLASGGTFAGTPSTAGSYSFTVQAQDSVGARATKALGISLALPPVSVSVSPAAANLCAGQTQQFTANVLGTKKTGVAWKVNGVVGGGAGTGSISSIGLYTALSTIASSFSVTVTAASQANPSATAQSIVTLQVPIAVQVSPGSAALSARQTQQFTATVTGTANTAVTWSLNSAVGTISSGGLYTAPATLGSLQTVTVTATSVADTSKAATANVTITPPVTVSLTPTAATMLPAQAQTFTPTVGGTTNTSVTWSIAPATGVISSDGLYTAPAIISSTTSVTVAATSVADATKSASAAIALIPPVQITTSSLPGGTAGTAYNATVSATGGVAPYTWSIPSGQLPPGTSLSTSSGAISGTPTTAGSYNVTMKATDAAGYQATAVLAIAIAACTSCAPPPTGGATVTITNADLPNGTVRAAYTARLSASGGTPPYAWSIGAGTLPAGLALDPSTGTISGTPASAGWSNFFTIQAQDSAANVSSLAYSIIVSPTLDQYGGSLTARCAQSTGWFHAEKINNRWWLCTPAGNALFSTAIAAISSAGTGCDPATGQCNQYDTIATAKYGNTTYSWGPQQNKRLQLWGFNSVGEVSSPYVYPYSTCTNCSGWPNGQQPVKLPDYGLIVVSNYAGVNLWGYAERPMKNMTAGINTTYYKAWPAATMDFFEPAYGTWLDNFWTNDAGARAMAQSPWTIGMFLDDTDWFWGMGPGPDFHSIPGGHTNSDPAYMVLITSPLQTFTPSGSYANQPLLYADPTLYSKTAMASPPATCSIATPCSLRDYLYKRYSGNIASLNSAWGSNYTTFDSGGVRVTGELVGTGDGTTTVFSASLTQFPVSPLSVTVRVASAAVTGDCPWWNTACATSIPGIGTLGLAGLQWAPSNDYSKGWYVTDSNGNLQIATTNFGTSGNSAPAWSTTLGATTADRTVTWRNQGPSTKSGAQPWLSGLNEQSCRACGLPPASYYVKIVYHMTSGASSPSRLAGDTVGANTQVIVTAPGGIASATGYDVYVACMNQRTPGVPWCLPNGTVGDNLMTLQASNVPFDQNWTEPTGGLINGAPLPQAPSTMNYSNGQLQVTFAVPPAAGARVTVDYTANGWGYGPGLMDEDGRHTTWLGTNPYCLLPAAACDGIDMPLPNAHPQVGADLDAWISQFTAHYFSTSRNSFKSHYPNMMYLGADTIGGWGAPARKEILAAAAPYVDAATVTWYGQYPDPAAGNAMYQYLTQYLGDTPLINGGFMPATSDSALWRYPNSSVFSFTKQEQRGQGYSATISAMLTTPSHNQTFQWVGMDFFGISDHWGEKINWGPVSLNDNPYDGKSACQASRIDPWGFSTGAEEPTPSWNATTAYRPPPSANPRIQVGIRGSSYIFEAIVAGTSANAAPVWPTVVNATVSDGTVVWKNLGARSSSDCFGDAIDYMKLGNALWYGLAR